jgi:hypothetical protein
MSIAAQALPAVGKVGLGALVLLLGAGGAVISKQRRVAA